jgi:hypothetical protein
MTPRFCIGHPGQSASQVEQPKSAPAPAPAPTTAQPAAHHPLLHDHARDILANAPLDSEIKSTLWDLFYDAPNSNTLVQNLAPLGVPDQLKHDLVATKKLGDPQPNPGVVAVHHLAGIDRGVLDVAEKHPTILNNLISLVTKH